MADKTYVVKAAGALVYRAGNQAVLLHRGATVPDDANPVQLQLLLKRGLVEEGVATGGLESDPDVPPPFPGVAERAEHRGKAKSD